VDVSLSVKPGAEKYHNRGTIWFHLGIRISRGPRIGNEIANPTALEGGGAWQLMELGPAAGFLMAAVAEWVCPLSFSGFSSI
jgi:hypothetical protein